jgi:BRCT domain type II-containing protein
MATIDLTDKNVVLTGTFTQLSRADAEAHVTRMGGRVSGSISAKTDILFAGDKAGSKLEKAKSLKIAVYDEAALVTAIAAAKPKVAAAAAKTISKKAEPEKAAKKTASKKAEPEKAAAKKPEPEKAAKKTMSKKVEPEKVAKKTATKKAEPEKTRTCQKFCV